MFLDLFLISLFLFFFQYGSPANKVPWNNKEQKNTLAILIALLKNPERQNGHTQAKILQAIKIFTYVFNLIQNMNNYTIFFK